MTYTKDNIVFQPIPNNPRFIDLTKHVFERLTVLGYAGKMYGNCASWWCQCICGIIKPIQGRHLRSGKIVSCGCRRKELTLISVTKHGESRRTGQSVEATIFRAAKRRCSTPSVSEYHNYGGRGIEFRFTSIPEFLNELGRRPSPEHSLERIDNDGHYEVGNVRWATRKEQSRNKRNTVRFTCNEITLTAMEWGEVTGISAQNIRSRKRRGWCDTCAVSLPVNSACSHKLINQHSRTFALCPPHLNIEDASL